MGGVMRKDDLFAKIAKEHLGIETLMRRNRDCLDFHDISVWGVQAALDAAYEAGKAAGKPAKPDYENSKHKILFDLLTSETGATLQQMADATGWRRSSVSCALSDVFRKKRNLKIVRTTEAGKDPVYRIIQTRKGD